jgi:hypothetical protein
LDPSATAAVEPTTSEAASFDELPREQLPPPAAGQAEGEPPALTMESWVWDYVGSGWSLALDSVDSLWVSDEMSDRWERTYTTYLVSPEGETLRLFDLSGPTDGEYFAIHWDPTDRLAWFGFFNGDGRSVYEYDLETGTRSAQWGVGAFSDNAGEWGSPAARFEAIYVATQASGTEVWADGQMGWMEGLVFRDADGSWRASSVNEVIGSMSTRGVDLHVNADASEAIWWIQEGERDSAPVADHWIRHNLVADTWVEFSVQAPAGYANGCFSAAAIDGDFLDVGCITTTAIYSYRIDLRGGAEPVSLGSWSSASGWTIWTPDWSEWDRYGNLDGGVWEYIIPAP